MFRWYSFRSHSIRIFTFLGFASITFSCFGSLDSIVPLIGVGTHFAQAKGDPVVDIENIDAIGFSSFRDEIYWSSVEARPGQYSIPRNLNSYDEYLTKMESVRIKPLIILSYGNALHVDRGGQPISEEERSAFTRYVRFVVGRYKGRVYGYEIWNEWNKGAGSQGLRKNTSIAAYLNLVRDVVGVIDELDPGARIVIGSIAGRESDWLDAMLAYGLMDNRVDGISVHPYNFCDGSKSRPEDVGSWIKGVSKTIFERSEQRMGLYVTEIGWPNQKDRCGTSEDSSADYVARLVVLSRFMPGLRAVYFYNYQNDGFDESDKEHNFGFFRADRSPKPVVRVASDVLKVLESAEAVSDNSVKDLFSFSFKGGGGRFLIAWTSAVVKRTLFLPLSCDREMAKSRVAIREVGSLDVKYVSAQDYSGRCGFKVDVSSRPLIVSY